MASITANDGSSASTFKSQQGTKSEKKIERKTKQKPIIIHSFFVVVVVAVSPLFFMASPFSVPLVSTDA